MISLDSRYSFSRTGQPEAQQSTWGETRVRVKRPQSLPRVLITRTSTWIQFGSCFRNKCLWTFCYRFCLRPGALVAAATAAESLQSCPTLCDPLDGSPPGSAVPGILYARTLEWVAISSPMRESEVAQSCPTHSDPADCSLPGSIPGIFQSRVLEWGAIAISEECWWTADKTMVLKRPSFNNTGAQTSGTRNPSG